MSMTTWVTVSQASVMLGMSERSVRRHIAEGKLEAKLEGNRRLVRVEVDDDNIDILGMTVSDKDALIRWLRGELEERNRQISRLQDEIERSHERADTIIMRLTDELEAQRSILQGRRQPRRKRDKAFWQRLRRIDAEDGE